MSLFLASEVVACLIGANAAVLEAEGAQGVAEVVIVPVHLLRAPPITCSDP